SPVEFLSNRAELPLLELANCNPAPSVGTADHRAVHEPQHRPLPERMRDAMTQRKTQMSDTGLEVIDETLHHRGQVAAIGLDEVVTQQRSQRRRGRFIARARPLEILEERRAARPILLGARRLVPGARCSKAFRPSSVMPRGAE